MLAHLRRGTVQVRRGERVRVGDEIAACGNSGNSTEPHVHVQLMDHPEPLFAAGVPVRFDCFTVDGRPRSGMPGANTPFRVTSDRDPI